MRSREVPREIGESPSESAPHHYVFVGHSGSRPANEIEAVMVAAPHTEPVVSKHERSHLKDVIVDAVDQLTAEQQWIFDALFIRKASLRELGHELSLSKTSVARKRDGLLAALRRHLSDHPAVKEYLKDNG